MANPYAALGVPPGSGDEAIRADYISLVKRYPPDLRPREFQRARAAFESIRDRRARLRFLLCSPGQGDSFDEWMEELRCEAQNRRPTLEEIRKLFRGA